MADNNRNDQQNPNPQQANNSNEENPQDGSQWDNYQTRSISSEGEQKIEESDLLRADEVPSQNKDNASGMER